MTSKPFCGKGIRDGTARAGGDNGSGCVGGSGNDDGSGGDGNDGGGDDGGICGHSDGDDGERGRGGGGSEERLAFALSFQGQLGFPTGRYVQIWKFQAEEAA